MTGWPGGLRTQALMGFLILIGLTFGMLAIVHSRLLQTHGQELALIRANGTAETHRAGPKANVEEKLEEAAMRRTQQLFLMFLSVIALVLLVFVYAMFTFLVVRPVRAIGVAAERASAGDLASPITLLPGNEFGRVGRSFNAMLVRLEDGRLELERRLKALETANSQLAAAQTTLIRSEKLASVGQLAAGIAHEIGNPLAAISGYNDLLVDGGLDEEETRDLLERNRVQLQRIRQIIRKLLDFSRDDVAAVEATSARQCLSEALDLVRAIPRARAIRFEVQAEEAQVCAAPAELVQVLVNLVMNAVDALQGTEDAVVRAVVSADEDAVWIAVEDNGPGIPTELRDRVFEPFFTTKDPGEGTGLGLAICARILERFGAEISVEPVAGGSGSRFVVRLQPWTQT